MRGHFFDFGTSTHCGSRQCGHIAYRAALPLPKILPFNTGRRSLLNISERITGKHGLPSLPFSNESSNNAGANLAVAPMVRRSISSLFEYSVKANVVHLKTRSAPPIE